MIGSLRGSLVDRSPDGEVLVEAGGVGYRTLVTPATLGALGRLGSPVFLHVHTHVREDAIVLYGFSSRDERVCFEALIGAHGVGPALALAILSVHSPAALRRALADDDVGALTLVPGVGRKTAARLLLDLKSRLELPEPELVAPGGQPGTPARADLRNALSGLGYEADEVRRVLRELPDEGELDALLRDALRLLAAAR